MSPECPQTFASRLEPILNARSESGIIVHGSFREGKMKRAFTIALTGVLLVAALGMLASTGFASGSGSAAQSQYGGPSGGGANRPKQDSLIVFGSDRAAGVRELYVVKRDGTGVRRLTFNGVFERRPVWAPDRSRIAFVGLKDGNWDVYVVKADGSDLTRLTTAAGQDDTPAWTADGTQIVFTRFSTPTGFACPCTAGVINVDGTGERILNTGAGDVFGIDAAPSGRRIAFGRTVNGTSAIFAMDISGAGLRQVTSPPDGAVFGDLYPRWSPDGSHIAFDRDITGFDNDVFVIRSNGTGLRRLTNTPSRVEGFLSWSPDGSEVLTYADGRLLALAVDGSGEDEISTALTAPLEETFDDGVLDRSVWHDYVSGTGTSIGESSGELQVAIAADAAAGGTYNLIEGHWGTECSMPGDYDLQVDYRLADWPAQNGVRAILWAFFTDVQIQRESQTWAEQYFAWLGGPFGYATTADQGGSLRLVRAAGTVTAYWRFGEAWVPLGSAPDSGNAVMGVGAQSDDSLFANQPVRVAFDSFRINSGVLSCPSWWNALHPDWS